MRYANRKKDGCSTTTAMSTFVVVVPAYRPHLSDDERLSLRHLEHFLPEADKVLVMPEGLEFARAGYREARFAPAFFDGTEGYSRLVLSRDFYARFADYEYILIHQLDALVIGSDLTRFLSLGVDYLGAPWIGYGADGAPYFSGVGNGGLSLRRVSAFRRLLESRVPTTTAREYYLRSYAGGPLGHRFKGLVKACLKGMGVRNSIRSTVARSPCAEDGFIAAEARKYSPSFTFGTVDQALRFAFEREPRFCLEKAGGRMPLGAHAWSRYDRAFWEPHLLG